MHSNRKGDVMLKYVLKRLGYILVTLWVIVTCTFFMMKNLPGTPFDAERFSIMTPQQQERVLEMYGLNDSLPMQYVKYIKNMLKGDLGTSFTYVNQDVSKVITGRLGPSALIGIQAVLIGLAIGLILGILAAWKHNSGIDYFTMILAVLGVSVPNFVAAALLQYYIGLKWGALAGWILDWLELFRIAVHCAFVQCNSYGCPFYAYRNAGCTGSGLHRNCKSQGAEPDESPYASCSPQLHPSGCNYFRTNRSKPYDRISCCREHLQYSWYRKPFRRLYQGQ